MVSFTLGSVTVVMKKKIVRWVGLSEGRRRSQGKRIDYQSHAFNFWLMRVTVIPDESFRTKPMTSPILP